MIQTLLTTFEAAIHARNPAPAERLNPGLPENKVREQLINAQITGDTQPLIALYTWKNGTDPDETDSLVETSLFPESVYQFLPLETAIAQWIEFPDVAAYHPTLRQEIISYFPLFWDNVTGYIALDIAHGHNHRVLLLEFEDPEAPREAYPSFDEFIQDATRANAKNEPMRWAQLSR